MDKMKVSTDLRSPGLFGRKPILGLIMFIIGSLIFVVLAFNLINNGPLIKWDLFISEYFYTLALNSSPLVIDIMIYGYYVGLQGIWIIAILLTLYFLYKRFWREIVMVVVTLGGGGLLFLFLSNIFKRPRPFLLFDKLIWTGSPNIPGFPSGHTISIVTLCIFLVYLFIPKIKSYFRKSLVITIALLVIFYIGFSRLFVGDHYPTDIIAGYAAGVAWFGITVTFIELLFKKYEKKK